MKVKILLMPLIIAIIAMVSILKVYPAYTNGSDGVRENSAKLKNEQKKLAEIRNKSKNSDILSAQITSLPEKELLYSLIPENQKEEEIINDLVNLAAISETFLLDLTVDQPTKDFSEDMATEMGINELAMVDGLGVGDASVVAPANLPKIKNLKTEFTLVGSYEKIKVFLDSLNKLKRNVSFEGVDIAPIISEDTASSSDTLTLSAIANFSVLKKAKLDQAGAMDPIFSSNTLETKIIQDIKNKKNVDNFPINVDQKGKSNLFKL